MKFATKLDDSYIGKKAILKHGFASGLIGIIERNKSGSGVSPYLHVTKSGIKTGVMFLEQITLIED